MRFEHLKKLFAGIVPLIIDYSLMLYLLLPSELPVQGWHGVDYATSWLKFWHDILSPCAAWVNANGKKTDWVWSYFCHGWFCRWGVNPSTELGDRLHSSTIINHFISQPLWNFSSFFFFFLQGLMTIYFSAYLIQPLISSWVER